MTNNTNTPHVNGMGYAGKGHINYASVTGADVALNPPAGLDEELSQLLQKLKGCGLVEQTCGLPELRRMLRVPGDRSDDALKRRLELVRAAAEARK